jgi:hypothetical protein
MYSPDLGSEHSVLFNQGGIEAVRLLMTSRHNTWAFASTVDKLLDVLLSPETWVSSISLVGQNNYLQSAFGYLQPAQRSHSTLLYSIGEKD